jgi:hypothetical protein
VPSRSSPVSYPTWRMATREAVSLKLARLARLQSLTGVAASVVAIATSSERRVKAWSAVLDSIAAGASSASLETCVHTWNSWRTLRVAVPARGRVARRGTQARKFGPSGLEQQRHAWATVPRPIDVDRVRASTQSGPRLRGR